ncbi:MAG: transcription elongation factor GreA [Clostridia bacterium]|nr:transcription elongation factor GreA [Clostridia bacterium]
MAEEVILTKEGKEELEQELNNLVLVKRAEITERIKIARDFGDLSENAEYDAAKNEQARIEARINEIETMLKFAVVIDEKDKVKGVVSLGSTVEVTDTTYGEDRTFMIVGTTEADVMEGKISNESPIGNALLGRKPGEVVEVDAPEGKIILNIKKII